MGGFITLVLIVGGLIAYYIWKGYKTESESVIQQKPSPNTQVSLPEIVHTPPGITNLTLIIEESIAQKFKNMLQDSERMGGYQATQNLLPLVARYNVSCKEVDDYIREYRPEYLKYIEEQKQSSPDWATCSEKDRDDMLEEFKQKAILSLDIKPLRNWRDIEVLFSADDVDLTVDDKLIDEFGFELMTIYLSKLQKVHIIPADHYERKSFEQLVDAKLAVRGEDVPLELILDKLKLKEMTDLVTDLTPPKFSKKAKAIEYLMGVPDIKLRVGKALSFRSVFLPQPLSGEFSGVDLTHVMTSWQYAKVFTDIIYGTYCVMQSAAKNRKQYLDPGCTFTKFKIENSENCCPYCQGLAKNIYRKQNLPVMPLHIGCVCWLSPVFE